MAHRKLNFAELLHPRSITREARSILTWAKQNADEADRAHVEKLEAEVDEIERNEDRLAREANDALLDRMEAKGQTIRYWYMACPACEKLYDASPALLGRPCSCSQDNIVELEVLAPRMPMPGIEPRLTWHTREPTDDADRTTDAGSEEEAPG